MARAMTPSNKAKTTTLGIAGPADFAAAFAVSRETIAHLITYETLLRQWQTAVNLVATSTLDAIWQRHFADSAQLLDLAPAARTWVDLGSGAGFPGLVVAIMLADTAAAPASGSGGGLAPGAVSGSPTASLAAHAAAGVAARALAGGPAAASGVSTAVTLVESDTRKCAFLREVARRCGIAVDILSTRIESAATQSKLQPPDVVTARALAPLDKLLSLAAPLFSPCSIGLFLKGRDAGSEVEAARRIWTFDSELIPSRTERAARIVRISSFEPNRKEPRS